MDGWTNTYELLYTSTQLNGISTGQIRQFPTLPMISTDLSIDPLLHIKTLKDITKSQFYQIRGLYQKS